MTVHRWLVCVAVTGCALATSCSWTQTPGESDKFPVTWEIQEPTRTVADADLFLTESGVWAYKPRERSDFEPAFAPGEVAVVDTEGADHIFAVVDVARWGYRLQRLDDRPLQSPMTAELRAVTVDDARRRNDLCWVASPDAMDSACDFSYRHRRWHLFESTNAADIDPDSAGEQPVAVAGNYGDVGRTDAFPVVRDALAGGDALSTWVEASPDTGASGPLLAVRAHSRLESTRRATVAGDTSCQKELSGTDLVRVRSADLVSEHAALLNAPHPITVEDLAIRTGADAIVSCDGDRIDLLTPMVTRPLLRTDDGQPLAPPTFGLEARPLHEAADTAHVPWARAAALAAVGDAPAASFWIERAIAGASLPDFSLSAMSVLASAGLPEQAIRLGNRNTRGAWNPENVPDYLDGLIALFRQFDDHDALQKRLERRYSLASRRFESHRLGWYIWSDFRLQIADRKSSYGPGYEELIADLQQEGLDGWALSVWALLAIGDFDLPIVDDADDLNARYAEFDATGFWAAARGESWPTEAPTSWYGLFAEPDAAGELFDRLQTTAPGELRSGFSSHFFTDVTASLTSPEEWTAYWLAIAPLVPHEELDAATHSLVQALREQMARNPDSLCASLPMWKARTENAAARARAPILDRSRRHWLEFIEWWTDAGLDGLCGTSKQLLAAIDGHTATDNGWMRTVLPLVEDKMLQEPAGNSSLALLQQAADLARQLGADETCSQWNLAMSIGAIRGGHFDAAEDHLISATNCLGSHDPLRQTRDVVAGYLDFERGAGRGVVRDGGVESVVAAATRRRVDDGDVCVGLLPMGFDLDSQLPSSVMRIAGRLDISPAPHGEFRLRTASTVMDDARAAYLAGIRDIQRGELETAARALSRARADFRRLEHLPGLARIHFLDGVIFDGQVDAIAGGDDSNGADNAFDPTDLAAGSEAVEHIRRGESHHLLRQKPFSIDLASAGDTEPLIAALLIHWRIGDLDAPDQTSLADLHALCDADRVRYADSAEEDAAPIIVDDETPLSPDGDEDERQPHTD